jgi:polyhydroxyalkanoate synthesis regulator phasin
MADILKDAFKLGLGAVDLARDEANTAVDKLQKNYKSETAEGRKELKRLLNKTKDKAQDAHKDIKKEVKKALKDADLVTENDFEEFASTIEKLGKTTHRIVTRAAEKVEGKVKDKVKKSSTKKSSSKKPSSKKSAKKPSKAKKRR